MSTAVDYVDTVRDRLDAVLAETIAANEALEGIEARLDETVVVVTKRERQLRFTALGVVGMYGFLNLLSPRVPGPLADLDLNDFRLFTRIHDVHLYVYHFLLHVL